MLSGERERGKEEESLSKQSREIRHLRPLLFLLLLFLLLLPLGPGLSRFKQLVAL
jgi:hypothetical protein